ncbi:MAG: hypothetical protein ACI9P7_001024 [Candidatus Azotimanducaceae bacterium]|jgi:hypothetical protein
MTDSNAICFTFRTLPLRAKLALALILMMATGVAYAGPVDLSSWTATSGGSWNVQSGNDSVLQTTNGSPTFFYESGDNAQGQALSGKIQVVTTGDDDYIGFALGFDASDINSASADYILVDWKQLDQHFAGSQAYKGISISHVSDSTNTSGFPDFWSHQGGVNEIQRATNLGSTGWADNTEYVFDLQFTASLIQVSVNNVLEISITAADAGLTSFDDGSFAFYNFSQSQVLYSAVEEATTSLPVGGAAPFFLGIGLLLALARKKRALR